MQSWFTKERLNILSQLFTNLAAGWFGVILIIPGVTKLDAFSDFLWLFRNLLFGILALSVAMILSREN